MSDSEIGPGGPLPTQPNTYNPIAAVGFPVVGTPVAINSSGEAVPANATAPGTLAQCIGLTTAPCSAGQRVPVRYAGPLSLTPAEVAAILDTGTALVPGTAYFVSTTAGKITLTAPSGSNYQSAIGTAVGGDGILINAQRGFEASPS